MMREKFNTYHNDDDVDDDDKDEEKRVYKLYDVS